MKVNQCTPVYVAVYSEVTGRSRAKSLKCSRHGAVLHASESEAASFYYFTRASGRFAYLPALAGYPSEVVAGA